MCSLPLLAGEYLLDIDKSLDLIYQETTYPSVGRSIPNEIKSIIAHKVTFRKDKITADERSNIIENLLNFVLSTAHAKCSSEYERDRIKLRSKFQKEEDLEVLASFAIGWIIKYMDWGTLSTAYTAFTMAKSAMAEDKTGFIISVVAMAAPYLWNGVKGSMPGWGDLMHYSHTRAILGGTLTVMNGIVAMKSKENMEKSLQRVKEIEKALATFKETATDDGSFDLCPEEGASEEEVPEQVFDSLRKTYWYNTIFAIIFPSANAKTKPVGMMGQGCANQQLRHDASCSCSTNGSCLNVIPPQYYTKNIPGSIRRSFDYLARQMNNLNNGTMTLDQLNLKEIKKQREFLTK